MHSHLTFHLVSSVIEVLKNGFRPNFCYYPIKYATASLANIPGGQLLLQSFSHYLVYLELFEYVLKEELTIYYAVHQPTIFMLFTLDGRSNNYVQLSYCVNGRYQSIIPAGNHKILFLTVHSEWLIRNSKDLPEFQPLLTSYLNQEDKDFTLAQCPISKEIYTSIRKMQSYNLEDEIELDALIYRSINRIIKSYHKMLVFKRYTTIESHQRKATEISDFVNKHYAEEIVDNVASLAQKFMLSEKSFLRLAKIAFDKPIHQHVIHLRMHYGLKSLLTTKENIYNISISVGYKDSKYFSKAFKKHFGVLPHTIQRPVS